MCVTVIYFFLWVKLIKFFFSYHSLYCYQLWWIKIFITGVACVKKQWAIELVNLYLRALFFWVRRIQWGSDTGKSALASTEREVDCYSSITSRPVVDFATKVYMYYTKRPSLLAVFRQKLSSSIGLMLRSHHILKLQSRLKCCRNPVIILNRTQ